LLLQKILGSQHWFIHLLFLSPFSTSLENLFFPQLFVCLTEKLPFKRINKWAQNHKGDHREAATRIKNDFWLRRREKFRIWV